MISAEDHNEPWKLRAVCVAENWPGDIFFESRHEHTAKNICRRCPVSRECLDYQLAWEADAPYTHRYGIFGGHTPAERAELAAAPMRWKRWSRHYCDRCGTPWRSNSAVVSGLCAECGGRATA